MTKKLFGPARIREFRAELLAWFDVHKRDLPWRRTADPYALWVSEIMLQQTRVAAVLEHYAKWMVRFPTVEALAAAPEDEVLAVWSGLGYYRRARFLHQGAKAVVAEYGGTLPVTATELRKLPSIGTYTSAAIASIAFGEAVAVVDGNVERVLLRQTGNRENGATPKKDGGRTLDRPTLTPAEIQQLASRLIEPQRPGDFNQAMMELGATVCLPRSPLCLQCPVQKTCRTRGEHPTAARKSALNVDVSYGLLTKEGEGSVEVLLEQRPSSSTVMPGMWELPRLEDAASAVKTLLSLRHAIMRTNYRVGIVEPALATEACLPPTNGHRRWVPQSDLATLPLTGLARKVLLRLSLLPIP